MRGTLSNVRASALALCAALSACGEPAPELREWRPSDHQLPEGYPERDEAEAPRADPGATLYGTFCASCHGARGLGDGPGHPPMARMPSFADPAIQAHSDAEWARVITEGRGGFMPAFGDRLSPEGVSAIVAHLRTLR